MVACPGHLQIPPTWHGSLRRTRAQEAPFEFALGPEEATHPEGKSEDGAHAAKAQTKTDHTLRPLSRPEAL